MSKNNDCMFQYATRHRILADTGLISRKDADGLFEKNKDDFIERHGKDEEPEMAIWINCKDNSSYGETATHWCADDVKIIDGDIYIRA